MSPDDKQICHHILTLTDFKLYYYFKMVFQCDVLLKGTKAKKVEINLRRRCGIIGSVRLDVAVSSLPR